MKNTLILAAILVFASAVVYAQIPDDTSPKTGSGIDFLSVGVGLVVGVLIGYVLGARSKK